jgi:DNA-binding CsgD family transcriptional regulator
LKYAFDEVLTLGYYYNEHVSRTTIRSVTGPDVPDASVGPRSGLTDRELHFLKLACSEKTYYEIAKEMFISERTVDGYRDSLFRKLSVTSRVGLVLYAIRHGIMVV